MRKIIALFIILCGLCGRADALIPVGSYPVLYATKTAIDIDKARKNMIIFEYNDQTYYIDNLEEFLNENDNDACVNGIDGPESLYNAILGACRTSINHFDTANLDTNAVYRFGASMGQKAVSLLNNRLLRKSNISEKSKMTICLLSKELLLPQNIPTSYPYTHSINSDIQKCVASLGVHDDPNTCPVDGWYVSDKKYLISQFDIQPYVNRSYSFTTDVSQPLIAVFNGYLILLCDGERLVHVVQPAYSGLQQCQGGVFETLPNQGSAPDGVYLVKYSEIQDIEKLNLDQKSWGKYRIPLRPAKETDTHGRTGMYFHGTTVADKRQSAGCISLGTGIDAFIDDFYLGKNRDMIIIVNKVDFVDEEWNYRPYESH